MGWINRGSVVIEDSTGEEIAQVFGVTATEQVSRSSLLSMAPVLYDSLTDLLMHAKKNFPPELQVLVEQHNNVLNEVRLRYERESRANS